LGNFCCLRTWNLRNVSQRDVHLQSEIRIGRRLGSQLLVGNVVVEAGANIGAHTVALTQAVGPEGRVIAFDPQPTLI